MFLGDLATKPCSCYTKFCQFVAAFCLRFFQIQVKTRLSQKQDAHTHSFVDQQSVGPPHVNAVSNLHVLQILSHLSTFRELGVHILEVHL